MQAQGIHGFGMNDKSPQLVANKFLHDRNDFDSNDIGGNNKYFNQ